MIVKVIATSGCQSCSALATPVRFLLLDGKVAWKNTLKTKEKIVNKPKKKKKSYQRKANPTQRNKSEYNFVGFINNKREVCNQQSERR